jgi:hypothetical protein
MPSTGVREQRDQNACMFLGEPAIYVVAGGMLPEYLQDETERTTTSGSTRHTGLRIHSKTNASFTADSASSPWRADES